MSVRSEFQRAGRLEAAWAAEGRVFYASDADQNDLVTAVTSFAATTPTFLLQVPSGTTAVPLLIALGQTGTVAGAAIDVIVEIDNADRYSTGGTAETIFCARTTGGSPGQGNQSCVLYSGATAAAGYGIRIDGVTLGPDVSPAEGAVNSYLWLPQATPDFLVGPASLLIYTYAGTTAPTWFWTIKWAEFRTGDVG